MTLRFNQAAPDPALLRVLGRARTGAATPDRISRTMSEMRDAGLVENVGGEGVANERWRLTELGERVTEQLARGAEVGGQDMQCDHSHSQEAIQ